MRGGLSWQLPLRLAGDQFIISVPDAVLNEAMYPLAVDPLITPEFALDVPVDGPSPATRSAPVIAANDSGFLVAWCQGKSEVAESGVFAARIAPSGLLLDPQGIRVSGHAGEQSVCAVAAIDDMFLVTWAAPRGTSATDWDVLGARVLADGTVLDSPLPIGALAGSVQNSPAVAGNGQNFLVTWRDSRNTGIYGTIVTREGSLSTTNGISVLNATYDQYTPAVAALGTNYLVVAQDYRRSTSAAYNSDVYGARVSGLGMLLDPVGFPICTNAGSQFRPAVAADGTNYLVVWEDYDVDGSNIRAARVTGEGVVLDPVALVVSHAVNRQGNPTVTADGGGFVVAWQDHRESTGGNFEARIRAARVSGDGTVLDAAGVPVSSGGGGQNLPCITSRGQDWLAVWQDLRSNPDTVLSDIFGAGGSGPNPGAEMKLSPTANAQISPAVARLGETYLAVWADNRHDGSNSWDICGLRLDATGNPLDAAPFWICAAPGRQSDPSIASGENRFLVVWSDWRNSPATLRHADVYGTAVSPDGAVLHPGGKSICTATNDQSLPAIAGFGTNFLVTWQDSRSNQPPSLRMDIFASRVTETGVVLDQGGLPVCTHLTIQTNPVVAANRDLALVVWTDYRSSATYPDIYGARLTPDGTVLESNGFPICLAANTTQYLPAVATDGSGFLVVWADSRSGVANAPDIYGTEVTASGAVSSLTGLGIRTGPGPQTVPELAFNGRDYLVAWQTAPSATGTFDIHAVQVESLTAPLVQAGVLPVTTDSTAQLGPAVAPGPDGRFLVLWQSLDRFVPRITGSLVDSGAVPRLDSPNIAADGQFQFRFRGSLGQRYDIERSAELQQWTRILSFTNAVHSSLLADPEANTGGRRFYRALLVP